MHSCTHAFFADDDDELEEAEARLAAMMALHAARQKSLPTSSYLPVSKPLRRQRSLTNLSPFEENATQQLRNLAVPLVGAQRWLIPTSATG